MISAKALSTASSSVPTDIDDPYEELRRALKAEIDEATKEPAPQAQSLYVAYWAYGPISLLIWPVNMPALGAMDDSGVLVGEASPMVVVGVCAAVVAIWTWRSNRSLAIYVATAFTAFESLIGLIFVGIGLLWGPAVAVAYLFLPIPAPPLLAWATLAVFVIALRRCGGRSLSATGAPTGGAASGSQATSGKSAL